MAFLFAFSTQTFAVDYTVNQITDQHDASLIDGICDVNFTTAEPECTLRAAIEQANNFGSDDRVLFNLQPNSIITLTTTNGGEIPISNNGTLEIVGTGANNLTIDGGAGENRIFYTNQAIVTISGVTLTGGNGVGAYFRVGGAIRADGGSLTLDRVHVTGNSAGIDSGGVDFSSGTHRITNSTFSGNAAGSCGGFRIFVGTLTVLNSTISGNTAAGSGGGFCNSNANITLRNVTVTNNMARNGGGIIQVTALPDSGIFQITTSETRSTINLGSTIVAGNTASNSNPEISNGASIVTSAGGNLIGDSPGDSTNIGGTVTYQPTDIRDVNPLLGALQNNGGTTPTHALLTGSPAIDKGLNALVFDPFNGIALAFDQRGTGFSRIVDGDGNGTAIVDIGAYEAPLGTTAATVTVSGRVITAQGRGIRNVVVTMTDSAGNTRTATSSNSGYYRFTDVPAGETYIFTARGKRFSFGQNTQVHSIMEDTSNINFIANERSVLQTN